MKTVTAKKKASSNGRANGLNGHGAHELVKRIRAGIPFRDLEKMRRELALPLDQLAEKLGISRATLHRRKAAGRLDLDESDRVVRYQRLLEHAIQLFGDSDRASQWLKHPQYGLGGAVPLDYARTEAGAREVDAVLGRIEWGDLA
ncbi:MAG: DUF2384 domain-containing protein [Verrucomicrobiota bacterium]|nr:DUF2384 domain-containing protein [Verrucomicrobiota bacterium]